MTSEVVLSWHCMYSPGRTRSYKSERVTRNTAFTVGSEGGIELA
jgi:hypothetical protein